MELEQEARVILAHSEDDGSISKNEDCTDNSLDELLKALAGIVVDEILALKEAGMTVREIEEIYNGESDSPVFET